MPCAEVSVGSRSSFLESPDMVHGGVVYEASAVLFIRSKCAVTSVLPSVVSPLSAKASLSFPFFASFLPRVGILPGGGLCAGLNVRFLDIARARPRRIQFSYELGLRARISGARLCRSLVGW
jgi:hypothetical protein